MATNIHTEFWTEIHGVVVSILLRIREVPSSIFVRRPCILTKGLLTVRKSLQANSR
jgi:hypothetical protein